MINLRLFKFIIVIISMLWALTTGVKFRCYFSGYLNKLKRNEEGLKSVIDLTRNTRCQHFRKEEWNLKRGFQQNKEYVKFFVDCTDNERTYRVQIKGVAATERREKRITERAELTSARE